MSKKYLAFDFGASGGRALIGTIDNGRLALEEIHRFWNGPVFVNGNAYWDAFRLLEEIKQGIRLAVKQYGSDIAGIGIDTWGVDFGLLGPNDLLIEMPRHYRDSRTDGLVEEGDKIMPRAEVYAHTGIQFMQLNTLYQLFSVARDNPWMLENAERMLMMPDLFNFWLTGVKANEFTISSTSQMHNPVTGSWATDMLEKFGIPSRIFGNIVQPGTVLGPLSAGIMDETKAPAIPVIAVASHDTASAFAAVPATNPDSAYISSGTWSLVGIESENPIISEKSLELNFTNEGGIGNTRFLRNVMGLWLIQECRRVWAEAGKDYSWADLVKSAEAAQPFKSIIDPDYESFLKPCDMPQKIRDYCRSTGQPIPETEGEVTRAALDSLALKYRWVIEQIETMRGRSIQQVNVVGGGVQNQLLCQLTADITGRTVIAGPIEATAIGNVLVQAMGLGVIKSLEECRQIVRNSFAMAAYTPNPAAGVDEAYARFQALLK